MVNTERSRAELYERLDDAVGTDAADTLMGYLPPVGWADVATKTDLQHLEARIDARIDGLDASIDGRLHRLEASVERALRQTVLALVAAMVASVGAAVGITQALS